MDIKLTQPIPTKRSPGRPSTKKTSNIPFRGIVSMPEKICDEYPEYTNKMELLYNNPNMFKRIFKLLKNYHVNEILMRFTHDAINIFAVSHTIKNIIYITINGEKMNRYYCDGSFEISIDVPKFFDLMNSINNSHGYILFESTVADHNKKISISLKDIDIGEKGINILELNMSIFDPWETVENMIALEQTYPIEFGMPHKTWKTKVTGWAKVHNEIRIKKIGYDPLKIDCGYTDKRGGHIAVYENSNDIRLKSELGEMDILSVGVNLQFISGYSSSLVGNDVIIRVSADNPIIFTSKLDLDEVQIDAKKISVDGSESAIVKVLTCIKTNDDASVINEEIYAMVLRSQDLKIQNIQS